MTAPKRDRYHHGELPSALKATALELIAEKGVQGFSLAEASRRLGVAPSAPYAHFADRDDLLAAIAIDTLEMFHDELTEALTRVSPPRDRLAAFIRTYVRFAATHATIYETLFQVAIDKAQHPNLAVAERRIDESFRQSVQAVSGAESPSGDALAAAVEAVAHGHAMLLLDGRFGRGARSTKVAADSAARSALAVVDGWAGS